MHTHSNAIAPFFAISQPLESMPGEGQMRIASLGAFPQLMKTFGLDGSALLERHEIDPQKIRSPDLLIHCKSFTELLEDSSSALRAPLFGLKLAQLQSPDVYGCVVALCRAAPTMREAIESFIKYIRVTHSAASTQELVESETTAELRWHVVSDLGYNQQANYHAALLMMKLLCQIGGTQFRPSAVMLNVDVRNKDIDNAEHYFACRFHRDTTVNGIAFPREFLDRSIASSSRVLYRLLSGYLDQVRASSEIALAEQIATYVRGALPLGHCSIEHCAASLGMAVRTLQTKLNKAGLEFSTILDEQRLHLAKRYLQKGNLTCFEVAANLGYAEQSSFIRAFKRWTGKTPAQWRRQYN